MIRTISRVAALFLTLCFSVSLAAAADKPRCAECGMVVDESSRFSARIVEKGATLHFCDIGDLLTYMRDKKRSPAGAQVKDYVSGEWVDASTALYVLAPKKFSTPMGWNIGAFRDKEKALTFGTPLDLNGMQAALK